MTTISNEARELLARASPGGVKLPNNQARRELEKARLITSYVSRGTRYWHRTDEGRAVLAGLASGSDIPPVGHQPTPPLRTR